jgi:hypothetical protein
VARASTGSGRARRQWAGQIERIAERNAMETGTLQAPRNAEPPVLRAYDELPGPRGLPFLGNALQIDSTRFHPQLEQWCAEHGSIFKLRVASRRMIVVGDHLVLCPVSNWH